MSLAARVADLATRTGQELKILRERAKPVDLLTDLRTPIYISHRGGPLVFPEHSIEAYRASVAAGYTPEVDIHALSDGTLVCIHDTTTNRTMDISANVSALTPAQWKAAKIKPPANGLITGTGTGTPVFFNDFLDEFGGTMVLFAELKITGPGVTKAIQTVIDRKLQRSVVLESFDLATCAQVVAAGITTLFASTNTAAATIVAAGVEYVGVSMTATTTYVNSLKAAGLKVIAFTIKTKAEADTQLARGCVGVFCDDPWEASRLSVPTTDVDLSDGYVPPGSAFIRDPSNGTPNGTMRAIIDGGTVSFVQDGTAIQSGSIRLGTLGHGAPNIKLRFWAQSIPPQAYTGAWMIGVYLGFASNDNPVNEEPGDGRFRLAMIRRDGRKHIYEKRTDAATGTELGVTATPSTPYAPAAGRSEPMLFEVEFTSTSTTIRNLTRNDTDLVTTNTAWSDTSNQYVTFRVNGAQAKVWGIHASRT